MAETSLHPLELILRQCAAAAPSPWYPASYAETAGIARDQLDAHLDQLRLNGLVQLTKWVSGRGQGYALTPDGVDALHNPRRLAQLRAGHVAPGPGGRDEPRAPSPGPTDWERGESVRSVFM